MDDLAKSQQASHRSRLSPKAEPETSYKMALLPTQQSFHDAAVDVFTALKKGDEEARNEFVWSYQEKIYAIAFIATGDNNEATELTISAFKSAFDAVRQINLKKVDTTAWEWLVNFIVDACAEYHSRFGQPSSSSPRTDPSADGSSQMDWETTIILGTQRVKRCLTALPHEQKKVFLLRHNFQLNYDQIGAVLNQTPESVMAWLFRARVQIVKCLGRG